MKRGSIIVGKGQSGATDQQLYNDLVKTAEESGIEIHAVTTGYTGGVNIGSPSIDVLQKPEIAILVDGGVSSSDAGEVWHLLDQRFQMPATLLPVDRFNSADLSRYNVIVFSDGNYNQLGKSGVEKTKDWVRAGGTAIATGRALNWFGQNEIAAFKFKNEEGKDTVVQRKYADFERAMGAKVTGGAIFNVHLDITHPIGYGYEKPEMFTFRGDNLFMVPSENAYANPMVYTANPLASGYIHPSNLEQIKNSGAIRVSGVGRGRVIGFVDNPNFRGFWFGTNKLFLNAIFFGQTIQSGTAR
jgi:hypothetical protein